MTFFALDVSFAIVQDYGRCHGQRPGQAAFVSQTTVTVTDLLPHNRSLGANQTIIIPALLFKGGLYQQLLKRLRMNKQHV